MTASVDYIAHGAESFGDIGAVTMEVTASEMAWTKRRFRQPGSYLEIESDNMDDLSSQLSVFAPNDEFSPQ